MVWGLIELIVEVWGIISFWGSPWSIITLIMLIVNVLAVTYMVGKQQAEATEESQFKEKDDE